MKSNTPFAVHSACGCGGGGPTSTGAPDSSSYWVQSNKGSATGVCGNIALSPIDCTDCCEAVDVLPPYVPSPADVSAQPACNLIPD